MGKLLLVMLLLLNLHFISKCEIINSKVTKVIDIRSQLVKISTTLLITNKGLKPIDTYTYVIDPDVENFYIIFRNQENVELSRGNCIKKWTNCNSFNVLLDKHLARGEHYTIKVEVIYINKIAALYKTLTFEHDHSVTYSGNVLFYSPYKTLKTEVTYPWKYAQELTVTPSPHRRDENGLHYSYRNTIPLSYIKIVMIFINNKQFPVVTNLERIIDVSHFGRIYVEDRVEIKNQGSKLVGPYEVKSMADAETVREIGTTWFTHLPASAEDIKLFDTLGNSSKSRILHFQNYKTLEFVPRYPLLRGWKTFYIISYSVPSFEYLFHSSNGLFVLKMRAVDHILDDVIIEKASVRVLLPEAANIVKVNIPFGFQKLKNEKLYTSLTTFGRPAIVLNGSNILENHIADFKVKYLFPTYYLLRVPLVIILYLETVFICLIIFSRVKSF